MEILLNDDLQDCQPDSSYYLHLFILCSSVKYCLGTSKSISFTKLSYIFDNVLSRNNEGRDVKNFILPWDLDGYFRKSLVLAHAQEYLSLTNKGGALFVQITDHGEIFLAEMEKEKRFENHLDYIKKTNRKETEFANLSLGCVFNEY